jgi:hypothetical protein
MLVRKGPFNEDELVEACKRYLPIYGRKDGSVCEVPYRDGDQGGKICFCRFTWLAEQWVFTDFVSNASKDNK